MTASSAAWYLIRPLQTMPEWDEVEGVFVNVSPVHGHGLFARNPIQEGDYLGCYEGRPTTENGMHVLWVEGEEAGTWAGYDGTNALRFLNHSSEPNAELDGQDLYASRDIPAGQEITIDYGEWFESED
jgi:hypothetical protein